MRIYPNDVNGDVLRRMQAQGDDLTKPRNVDFTVVFADENSAALFAEHFRSLGHEVSVEFTQTNQECPWDVVVVQHMVPPMMRSLVLRTYYNPLQMAGEDTTMAGVVSPSPVQRSERVALDRVPRVSAINLPRTMMEGHPSNMTNLFKRGNRKRTKGILC